MSELREVKFVLDHMNTLHGTILVGNADDYDDDDVHLIEGQPEHLPRNNGSLSEGSSPEVGCITATEKGGFDSMPHIFTFWFYDLKQARLFVL